MVLLVLVYFYGLGILSAYSGMRRKIWVRNGLFVGKGCQYRSSDEEEKSKNDDNQMTVCGQCQFPYSQPTIVLLHFDTKGNTLATSTVDPSHIVQSTFCNKRNKISVSFIL